MQIKIQIKRESLKDRLVAIVKIARQVEASTWLVDQHKTKFYFNTKWRSSFNLTNTSNASSLCTNSPTSNALCASYKSSIISGKLTIIAVLIRSARIIRYRPRWIKSWMLWRWVSITIVSTSYETTISAPLEKRSLTKTKCSTPEATPNPSTKIPTQMTKSSSLPRPTKESRFSNGFYIMLGKTKWPKTKPPLSCVKYSQPWLWRKKKG